MAMSNSERQARWRARLKARAERNGVEAVFREHMRSVLLREERFADCADEEELRVKLAAADSLLAQSDEKLVEVLNALIFAWHDEECLALSTVRREAPAPRRQHRHEPIDPRAPSRRLRLRTP